MAEVIFYILIGITGFLTVTSDILKKKIKNKHLILIAAIAIILYIIFGSTSKIKISLPLFLNPFIALAIGFLLYSCKLWKAGDAKLFIIYSLLTYQNSYSSILPLSCFVIFINTFFISFIFLIPYIVKNIIDNKNSIGKKIVSSDAAKYFLRIIGITFSISWIIKPLLKFLPLHNILFLEFIFVYCGYLAVFRYINRLKKKKILVAMIFLIGLAIRYLAMPESLQPGNVYHDLKRILQFSFILYIIRIIIDIEEGQKIRIPLAPFMFLGTVLSNTNFLNRIINLLAFIRK